MNQDQKRNKYYCKRCKRYLPYKICPIHGLDYMEVIKGDKKAPKPDSLYTDPQQSTSAKSKKINDKWALPAPGENQSLSNLKTPNPDAKIARLDDDLSQPPQQNGSARPAPKPTPRPQPRPQVEPPRPQQNGRPTAKAAKATPSETFDIKEIFKDVQFDEPPREQPPRPPRAPEANPKNSSHLEQKIEESLSSLRSARNPGSNSEFAESLTSIDIDAIVTEKPRPNIHSNVHPNARRPDPVAEQSQPNPAVRSNTPPPQPQRRKTRRKPVGQAKTRGSLPRIPAWAYIAAAVLVLIVAGTIFTYQQTSITSANPTPPTTDEPGAFSQMWDGISGAASSISALLSSNDDVPDVPEEGAQPTQVNLIDEAGARFGELMSQANLAYQEERFLEPAENSVIHFVEAILLEEPQHKGALDLRDQVLLHYFETAEAALDEEDYGASVAAYKNILKIKPDDPEIISEINRTLELKKVHDALNEMDRLASTQAEIKELQRQKYRLRSEIQTLSKNNTTRRGRTGSRPAQPVQVDGLDKLGIDNDEGKVNVSLDQNDFDALGIEAVSDDAPPLVAESMIDAGAKEYVRQDKPFIPRRLRGDETMRIEAECVVGKNGAVESVNILTPTRNPQLNQLALNAFQNYRFKPATYKGNPVRFKVTEVLEIEPR